MTLEILLGANERGEEVTWKPKGEKNPHFMVVGTSGSGKTETLKAMIHELSEQGVPSLIVDFHQDFEELADDVLDFNSVTINPLEFSPETPESVMYKVSHILKKIFALGVQQEGLLQDAILAAYRDKGVDIKSTQAKEAPTFEDVKETLESTMERLKEERRPTQTVETLLVRLRPLFNTGFFTEKKSTVPFKKVFSETTVLKLKNMPTEEVKYAIAEFFINKLKYELYARGKSDKMVLYCVVDEAHRLIDERSPLNDLLRESRKYGTGVILSSQRPSDFSDTVLANVGGILALQCRLEKDAIFVSKQMGVDFEKIKNLTDVGTGYLNLSSREGTELVKIKPLSKREKKEKGRGKKEKPPKEDAKERDKKRAEEEANKYFGLKPEVFQQEYRYKRRPKGRSIDHIPVDNEEERALEAEEMRITDEYRMFPPLIWLGRGAKRAFSDARSAIPLALVLGSAFVFLPVQQSLAVAALLLTAMMIIGKNREK